MRRQINMAQMKEQNKIPEKELNKMKITNLSDAEFKTLVIRMLKQIIEYSKNIREEMKVTLSEIKKILQGTIHGEDEAKDQINALEHKEEKSNQNSKNKKELKKNEDRVRSLWGNFNRTNI